MKKAKYLFHFAMSLIFAFLTFRSFLLFQAEATFSSAMMAANIIGLMVIWFFSYTAKSRFVRENWVVVVLIPYASIQILNISTHISSMGTSFSGLLLFIVSSLALLYFSFMTSLVEKNLV